MSSGGALPAVQNPHPMLHALDGETAPGLIGKAAGGNPWPLLLDFRPVLGQDTFWEFIAKHRDTLMHMRRRLLQRWLSSKLQQTVPNMAAPGDA